MSIIITENGKNAIRIDATPFENEDYLQKYISDNPEVIPIGDIKEGVQILVMAREFETKSGPMDILVTDRDGEIYIIETKLFVNPDKRKVLAQVMDYGASLWKGYPNPDNFINDIDNRINIIHGKNFTRLLQKNYSISQEESYEIIDSIKSNLGEGSFKFIVLMDKLEDRLKDLILFMNQNSKFDIYAVELEMYNHHGFEIAMPKLFGADVKKDLSTKQSKGKLWDEKSFFDAVGSKIENNKIKDMIKKLYDFTLEKSLEKPFYTVTKVGTFNLVVSKNNSKYSIFNVSTEGWMCFFWMNELTELRDALNNIGFDIPSNNYEKTYDIDIFLKKISLEKFFEVIKNFIK